MVDVAREICRSPAQQVAWATLALKSTQDSEQQSYLTRAQFCLPGRLSLLWSNLMRIARDQHGLQSACAFVDYRIQSEPQPTRPAAYLAAAAWLFDQGETQLAKLWYQRAFCLEPGHSEAIHQLAVVGRSSSVSAIPTFSLSLLERAVSIVPDNDRIAADLLFERHLRGEHLSLREVMLRAKSTSDFFALVTFSALSLELGAAETASQIASRALVVKPGSFLAYSKRALTGLASFDLRTAEIDLLRSQHLNPSALEPALNFARLLELRGDVRAALAIYQESIRRRPDLAEPQLNASIILLGLGEFAAGWRLYGARWDTRSLVTSGRDKASKHLITTKPKFDRRQGGRVLVWAEQGLGDEIMFASMFADVAKDAEEVIVQVDPRLIELFSRSFKSVAFYKRVRPVDESIYDSQIAAGDLGALYRTDLESFSRASTPYLLADSAVSQKFRQRLASRKKIIGISWLTTNPDTGRLRSVDLDRFGGFFSGYEVKLVSLQYKSDQEQLKKAAAKFSLDIDCFSDVDNFYQVDRLASLITCCDLVITIGNATAHLSAALGVRTWVITPIGGSWRWMFEGSFTPWYPAVEVFRQTKFGQWDDVVENLRSRLDKFLNE
jgi:tetratricopeptide (TPR) repeat protein